MLTFNRASRDHHQVQLLLSLVMIFMLPKLIAIMFLLIGDISRVFEYGFKYFTQEQKTFSQRRKFISTTALATQGIFSALVIDGIIFGKYRHTARKVKLKLKTYPKVSKVIKLYKFLMYTVVVFHPEKLQHAIDLINEQNADLVLFRVIW